MGRKGRCKGATAASAGTGGSPRSGLGRWLAAQLAVFHRGAAVVCACLCLVGGGMVRTICGSPWGSRAALQLGEAMPSMVAFWLIAVLWQLLIGAVFGGITFSPRHRGVISHTALEIWKGGVPLVATVLLGYLWYPVFFVSARFATAALLSVVMTALCLLAARCYLRVSALAGGVVLVCAGVLAWGSLRSLQVLLTS